MFLLILKWHFFLFWDLHSRLWYTLGRFNNVAQEYSLLLFIRQINSHTHLYSIWSLLQNSNRIINKHDQCTMYILKSLQSFSLPSFNRNTDNNTGARQWPYSFKKKTNSRPAEYVYLYFSFKCNALSNRWSINVNHKSAKLTKFTLLDQYTVYRQHFGQLVNIPNEIWHKFSSVFISGEFNIAFEEACQEGCFPNYQCQQLSIKQLPRASWPIKTSFV